jgi:hypothetical protein
MADPKSARKTHADQMKDAIWLSGSGCLESFLWIVPEIVMFGVDSDGDELATMRRFQVRTLLRSLHRTICSDTGTNRRFGTMGGRMTMAISEGSDRCSEMPMDGD